MKKDFSSKPYNRCLTCPHRQTACDGPRTAAMPLIRWKEFMRDMKDINGLTYAEIAEKSGLSERTVQNKLSEKNDEDVMRETARLIENAIIGSSNQYPCYLAFQDSLPKESRTVSEVEHEMEDLRKNIALIHDSYKKELDKVRAEAQERIDFLKSQIEFKESVIKKLLEKP